MKPPIKPTIMLISEVARELERSVSGVVALDPKLKPMRTVQGVRVYSIARVARYKAANPGKARRGRPVQRRLRGALDDPDRTFSLAARTRSRESGPRA